MATKTLYLLNTTAATPNWMGSIQDGGSAPTAVVSTFGWTVAKTSTGTPYWKARIGATAAATVAAASSTITSLTAPTQGTGSGATTAGDSFRSQANYTGAFIGTFAAGAWTFNFGMRCTTSSSQAGHINFRLWASNDPNGQTGVREITSGNVVCSTVTLSTTTTTYTSTASPSLPTFTVNGDYLFIQVEWQETVASGSNSGDVKFYISACTVATTDFQPIIIGPLSATDPTDTSAISGTVIAAPASGTLAATDVIDISNISGNANAFGPLSANDLIDTASSAGSVYWTATLSATDLVDSAIIAGTVVATGASGTLSAIDPTDRALFTQYYVQGLTQRNSAPSTTVVGTLPNAVGSRHSLKITISWVGSFGDSVINLQDDQGNLYQLVDYLYSAATTFCVQTAFLENITNGPTTLTATLNAARAQASIVIDEWATSGVLDGHSIEINDTTTTGTDNITSGSITTTGADRVYGSMASTGNQLCATGTGFTSEQIGTSSNRFYTQDLLQASAGSVVATWSYQGSGTDIEVAALMAFQSVTALAATDLPDTALISGLVNAFGTLATTDLIDTSVINALSAWNAVLTATDITDTSNIAATSAWQLTLSTTDAPDTSSIAGTVGWNAALAATEATDTSAISGNIVTVASGTLTATDLIDTSVISGQVVSQGTLAATDAIDTSNTSGTVAWSATLSATDPTDTAVVSGTATWNAVLAATEPPDTSNIAGSVYRAIALAATDPTDTSVESGTVAWTATLAATDLIDTAAINGTSTWNAVLSATGPTDTANLVGFAYFAVTGSFNITEPIDTAALTGTVISGLSAVLTATDPTDTAVLSATVTGLAATDPIDVAQSQINNNMLVSYTPGNTRSGAFWVGGFIIPTTNQTVTSIGCLAGVGNSGPTTVTLVDQSTGTILADTTVNLSAPSANGFCYGPITPTLLTGGHTYVLAANSAPMAGWADVNGSFATYGADFTGNGGCYNGSEGGVYTAAGGWPYWQYVGVDLVYTVTAPGFNGSVQWNAALAATDHADTANISGTSTWQATLAATESTDTAAISGTATWNATLAATDPTDTAALVAFAFFPITGTLSRADPIDTAAIAGQVLSGISATLAASDPTDLYGGAGTVIMNGVVSAIDPTDTASISGQLNVFGTLAVTDPVDHASIVGSEAWQMILNAVEIPDHSSLVGQMVSSGVLSATDVRDSASIRSGARAAIRVLVMA